MADKTAPDIDIASDPEEDDLDDLDDVLDEFDSKPKITQPKPTAADLPSQSTQPPPSGPGRPAPDTTAKLDNESAVQDDEDFAKQLQSGMANLISELGDNPSMQKQFEDMMSELIAAGSASTDAEAREHVKRASESAPQDPDEGITGRKGDKGKEDTFQDTIKRTMERMQQSDTSSTAASSKPGAGGGSEEEMLMQMMKELSAGGGAGGGEGEEEDFNKMLMSMMTQLTNKEILYEPMKELDDKFPAWMEKNAAQTKKDDLERYKEQQTLVREIVGRFERKGYSDDNEDDREYIVERMQKMQAAGAPPPDLVGDMSAAQEALGELDGGCPTQ